MDEYLAPFMASASSWLNSMELPAMEGDSPVLQFMGKWAYKVYQEREFILMYIHLLLSALFPIYVGCHATLRCPPSASDPTTKKKAASTSSDNEDDDELDEVEAQSAVEGLTPSDAILFPVFASFTLGGLYLLIEWLNDPALLNKILGYYFSLIGIFGVGKLAGDALNVVTTLIFPSVWSARGEVYHVDPLLSQQFTSGPTVQGPNKATLHRNSTGKTTPLPGLLSKISFPENISRQLWTLRSLFTSHWIFRGYVHGLMKVKTKVRLNDVIGFVIGIATIAVYNTSGRYWLLTNLIGFGFCYGTIQLISPTTFWTGTLVLAGLFVYDIVMVFYT
jgi:minor histocompatibility antigen H13